MIRGWFHAVAHGFLRPCFQSPGRILGRHVEAGMTVLDVGCGEGFFSLPLVRLVGSRGRVVCVDVEAEVIERLRKRAARAGLSGRIDARVWEERCVEADELTGRVDFALAFYVVHHAADARALMAGVHKALKPGGRFLVVEPGHHASVREREAVEMEGRRAGFEVLDHPRRGRDWAVLFARSR